MPDQSLVIAIAELGSMGDKVAAFVTAQNFLFVTAGLKGDFRNWIADRREWFLGGSIVGGFVYLFTELALGFQAHYLIAHAGYGSDTDNVSCTSNLLFGYEHLEQYFYQ